MPDKDEFTFDDKDELPKTDLSDVFADSELDADDNDVLPETDLSDVFADSEQESLDLRPAPDEPDSADIPDTFSVPETGDDVQGDDFPPLNEEPKEGGGRSRIMLLLILLLVVVAAGAYFFMDFGDMSSESPQTQSEAQQVVAVPPPSPAASIPAAPASPAAFPDARMEETAADVSAAPVAAGAQETAVDPVSATAVPTSAEPEAKPAAEAASVAAQSIKPAQERPVTDMTASEASQQAAQSVATGQGRYSLDAGAFMFPAQREELKKKIRDLGYEPMESDVKASVRLVRLRMGSYTKEQLPQALEQVASLTSGGFSLAKDGQHVVYAGSFADLGNVQRLKDRFLEKGITLVEEPVKVDKVLSLIRFGSFVTEASAEQAVKKAEEAGIPARVIVNK